MHRLEADSKFFRSLLVIDVLFTVVFVLEGSFITALVAAALILPCFWRYYERRLKSTTQAYIHVVTLHRSGSLTPQSN